MTEIKVNTENMRTTANAFQDKIDEWKGLVNQLWSLTEELNGMWEGDANISFNEMVDADRPRFDRLAGMMETYPHNMKTVKRRSRVSSPPAHEKRLTSHKTSYFERKERNQSLWQTY